MMDNVAYTPTATRVAHDSAVGHFSWLAIPYLKYIAGDSVDAKSDVKPLARMPVLTQADASVVPCTDVALLLRCGPLWGNWHDWRFCFGQ